MDKLFIFLQTVLPQHLLSRATGWLADVEWPWLKNALISLFISHYDVNMDEAVYQDAAQYRNFNDFFTRELQPGSRPLADAGQFLLSPADGAISQLGAISDGRIVQAKGQDYSVQDLLGGDSELARRFDGGQFITIYLSPRDYHRVHMPFSGDLRQALYLPGELFSVNETTAQNVPRLFARNERLLGLFDTELGEAAVIMVGALIVAGIESSWAGRYAPRIATETLPANTVQLGAGDEMGRFYLGSTVILLFQAGKTEWLDELAPGTVLRMGQAIARRS